MTAHSLVRDAVPTVARRVLRDKRGQFCVALLVMVVAQLVPVWGIIRPGAVPGNSDDSTFFLFHSIFLHDALRSGDLPMWNPYLQFGGPEYYGQLHPFTLLVHLLSPSGVFAFKAYTLLPPIVLAIGAWLFIGLFVPFFPARLLGTLMVQFGPFSFAYLTNPLVFVSYMHFPFLLYFAERAFRQPASRWNYLGLTSVAAMLVLSAYPHTIAYSLLATGLYITGRSLLAPASRGWRLAAVAWALALAFVALGIGAGLVALLSILDIPGQYDPGYAAFFLSADRILNSGIIEAKDLQSFFAFNLRPGASFSWFNNSLPWLTMGLLLYLSRPTRWGVALVIVALSAVAYSIAFGGNNPVNTWLVPKLPKLLRLDGLARALLISSTAFPLVSALGFMSLYHAAKKRQTHLLGLFAVVSALTGTVVATQLCCQYSLTQTAPLYALYGVAAAFLATGALGKHIPFARHFVVSGLVVLALATPLLTYTTGDGYNRWIGIPREWLKQNAILEMIGRDDSYSRHFVSPWNLPPLHNRVTLALLIPDAQIAYGIFGSGSYMSFTRHRGRLYRDVAGIELASPVSTFPLLRMASVRWVTSPRELSNPRLALLGKVEDGGSETYVYEVPNPLPRAYVPPRVEYASKRSLAPPAKGVEFDPAELAIIDVEGTERQLLGGQQGVSGPGQARITRYRNQRVEVQTSMQSAGWLILSDTFYPGWRAKVDGASTEVYQANYLFRAVFVPAGDHTVVFSYLPTAFPLGLILTIASTILTTALLWWIGHHPPGRLASHPPPARKGVSPGSVSLEEWARWRQQEREGRQPKGSIERR